MLRTVLLVVVGLVAGLAAAHWLTSSTPAADPAQPSGAVSAPSDLPARIAELERQLAAETERRGALEQHVGELDAQIEALSAAAASPRPGDRGARAPDSSAASAGAGAAPQGFGRRFRGPPTGEQRVEQLVDAGFSPDRAAWIEKRTAELTMQAMQAQYAQRRGENVDEAQLRSPDQTLRTELGDADYERYLDALGRPTKIAVFNVLASSPAEKAGLKAGDQILSYGGQRVFDVRELNDLTLQGTPGQPVTLEVQRDQQTVQLVIPRGPIGIGGGPGGGQFGRRP
jgi:membrane-associated protease RseP (regulator of RpoE activity)